MRELRDERRGVLHRRADAARAHRRIQVRQIQLALGRWQRRHDLLHLRADEHGAIRARQLVASYP